MTPLPRLLCYLDDATASRDDLGVLLAAVAANGPEVGIVVRLPNGTVNALAALALRAMANARPTGARVYVSGRADVALATGAHGIVARAHDLPITELRALAPGRTILASVHSLAEATGAHAAGADGVVAGTIWATPSHPDRAPAGPSLLGEIAAQGVPTFAIGGVTAERAAEAARAGAWGVAAIRAVWSEKRPYQAAKAVIEAVKFVS